MTDQAIYNKRWKITHTDHIREYNRRRYEENKQELLQQMAVWRKNNKERISEYNKKKRQENDILRVPLKQDPEPKFIYKIILRDRVLNFKKNN